MERMALGARRVLGELRTWNIFHNAMRVCVDVTSLFAQEADESDVLSTREFDRHGRRRSYGSDKGCLRGGAFLQQFVTCPATQ